MASQTPHALTRKDALETGRAHWFLGYLAIVHLTGGETGGALCVVEPARTLDLPPPLEEDPDFKRLAALAAEHGIDIIGPPGELP